MWFYFVSRRLHSASHNVDAFTPSRHSDKWQRLMLMLMIGAGIAVRKIFHTFSHVKTGAKVARLIYTLHGCCNQIKHASTICKRLSLLLTSIFYEYIYYYGILFKQYGGFLVVVFFFIVCFCLFWFLCFLFIQLQFLIELSLFACFLLSYALFIYFYLFFCIYLYIKIYLYIYVALFIVFIWW